MKKQIRIFCCLALLAMLLGVFSGCVDKNPPAPTETEGGTDLSSVPHFDLIRNGKTEYVITYNTSDAIAAGAASRIWDLFYELGGVSLGKRSDSAQYEKEVVIGAADRPEIATLAAKLQNADDFVISYQNGKLFLYAETGKGMQKLQLALRSLLLGDKKEKWLTAPMAEQLLVGDFADEVLLGNKLTLTSGGKTDYKIIYSDSVEENTQIAYFLRSEFKRLCGTVVEAKTERVKDSEYEILVGMGDSDRPELAEAKKLLDGTDDFAVQVIDKKLVLAANSVYGLLVGAEYIVQNLMMTAVDGTSTIYELDSYRHNYSGKSFTVSQGRLSKLYVDILNRYPTLYALYLDKSVSSANQADQQLCEALVLRMEGSAVFCVGKTTALHNGMIVKLDPANYAAAATLSGDDVSVPTAIANSYFGAGSATGATASLKSLAAAKGYTYYYDAANRLAIVSPAGVPSFAEDGQKVGDYTNLQYRNRMLGFFNNPAMPEPNNDTEQSRVVIEDAVNYFPEDAYDYNVPVYTNYYSPGVLTVVRNGKNVIYASNERCRNTSNEELSTVTMVRKTEDGGKTWQVVSEVVGVSWLNLFELNGEIWYTGARFGTGTVIGRINADGKQTEKTLWSELSAVHEPTIIDGYLYLPLDYGVASIPVTSDPLVVSNWTKTQDSATFIDRKWFIDRTGKDLIPLGDASCLEGNLLKGRDGKLYVLYRIESHPHGNYAVMIELSADRRSFVESSARLIDLPTTVSRFVIKYDAISDQYICISNLWTVDSCNRARNVMGISVSSDLVNWTVKDTLLVDREMMNSEASCWAHAFQYMDWDFDGEDIVLTVRETVGYSNTFHDGKYFTFYRLSNFRSVIA